MRNLHKSQITKQQSVGGGGEKRKLGKDRTVDCRNSVLFLKTNKTTVDVKGGGGEERENVNPEKNRHDLVQPPALGWKKIE